MHQILTLLFLLLLALPASAESVYRCAEPDGAAVLTSRSLGAHCAVAADWQSDTARIDPGLPITRRPLSAAPAAQPRAARVYPAAYAAEIEHHSRRWGVDPVLVRAVIHAESTFNPRAVSPKGAMGLMQLMPATARRFGVGAAFDPEQNIAGGVQYLAWLLRRYQGDWRLAVAGYNAGEGAVDKYKGVPPYRETRDYLQKVWNLSQYYRRLSPD